MKKTHKLLILLLLICGSSFSNVQVNRNPFARIKLIPSNELESKDLSYYPLNALRFLGSLQMNGKLVVVVNDPVGRVYSLQKGAVIAREHLAILDITENHVKLQPASLTPSAENMVISWSNSTL